MSTIVALLVLTLSSPWAFAATPSPGMEDSGTVYRYGIETVADRVHLLSQGNTFHLQPRGNVGVIEQTRGFVLVDSGGSPAAAREVIDFIRARSTKPVLAIVLTHWHGDHVLGVSQLLEAWPKARVIATEATRDLLSGNKADAFMPGDDEDANKAFRANLEEGLAFLRKAADDPKLDAAERAGFDLAAREFAQFAREMTTARRVPPNEIFHERMRLDDDTVPVDIRFPGRANTSGDAIVWLPKQRILFAGDTIVAPIPYGFNSYPREWVIALESMLALDPVVLVPGHGSAMRDRLAVERLIAMLKSVRTQAATFAADASITNVDAGKHIQLEEGKRAIAGEDPWLQRWFRNYWLGPIASSALREARGEAIVQGAH
jgi:glyoxylase-like metal-dependent hydrolase (beta-lactamase superfamily II)